MLEIGVMIEGQNGLTWPRWQRIAQLVEDAGFVGLFRSDHFTNSNNSIRESLELWTSLTWLASHTESYRIWSPGDSVLLPAPSSHRPDGLCG